MDASQLSDILLSLTSRADKDAEKAIRSYLRKPTCVLGLCEQVGGAEAPQVRQLAAVLLRKKINSYWSRMGAHQEAIKAGLLSALMSEQLSVVRKAIANVIAALSKHLVPMGGWDELLALINEAAVSADKDHRHMAMLLLLLLTEVLGKHMSKQFGALAELYQNCLRDPEDGAVRTMALRALTALVEFLAGGDEVVHFRELVPDMLNVARQCIETGDVPAATMVRVLWLYGAVWVWARGGGYVGVGCVVYSARMVCEYGVRLCVLV